MDILRMIVFLGLVRAGRYYNELICASIWGVGRLVTGFIGNMPTLENIVRSVISFGVAWGLFRYLRYAKELSISWFLALGFGGALLISVI